MIPQSASVVEEVSPTLGHLQRLLGAWGVLADLSFSDLLLVSPIELLRGSGEQDAGSAFTVLGHVRPSTGATLISADVVGRTIVPEEWPALSTSLERAVALSSVGTVPLPGVGTYPEVLGAASVEPPPPERVQIEYVPVRFEGSVVAVMVRVGSLEERRRSGSLERIYREVYHRLASMVASGYFPAAGEDLVVEDAPRVGDGLMLLDADGRVRFSSPNATSALHRMGVRVPVLGRRLAEIGIEGGAVDRALVSGLTVIEEVERRPDVVVVVHCIPLRERDAVVGAMVLFRDVTDLRRLGRLLLSKDAAIREVHHRVKNNLQTISSLLSLQRRRLDPGAGRDALLEAERRVRSIAVVHEVLSREPGDEVPFGEIVEAVVRLAEDSYVSGENVAIKVVGDLGEVPVDVATPMAVVLTELLQNAVEHAFVTVSAGTNEIELDLANRGDLLSVVIRDNGQGLPEGFDIRDTTSLGLSIVRDLVASQLEGRIWMESGAVSGRRGTTVTFEVPIGERRTSS
jgi:two-component sensor histidine kinase